MEKGKKNNTPCRFLRAFLSQKPFGLVCRWKPDKVKKESCHSQRSQPWNSSMANCWWVMCRNVWTAGQPTYLRLRTPVYCSHIPAVIVLLCSISHTHTNWSLISCKPYVWDEPIMWKYIKADKELHVTEQLEKLFFFFFFSYFAIIGWNWYMKSYFTNLLNTLQF